MDIQSFEKLYKAHQPALVSHAFFYLRNEQEATDLVQELFLHIWEKREQFPATQNPKAYLMTAARNRCYNRLSQNRMEVSGDGLLPDVMVGPEDTSKPIELREMEAGIQASIDRLPLKCREIFILSRFEHLSYKEIATQLDLSVKTVENQIGNALKLLRKSLKVILPLTVSVLENILKNA